MFVHRNIANLVVDSDRSCSSVLEYAVAHLKVPHIIVCGHYNCGGLQAALSGHTSGAVGTWLQPAIDLIAKYRDTLDRLVDETQRWRKLCELNVIEQVANVCRSEPVQQAWRQGQPLAVHGLIYELADGLLKDMDVCVTSAREIESVCERAVATWS
jgi:carbonic anhydrase